MHRARLLAVEPALAQARFASVSAKTLPLADGGGCELLWAGPRHDLASLMPGTLAAAPLEQVAGRGVRDRHLARVGSPHAIEGLLHAWVPAPHVDHVHPDAVAAICCSSDGAQLTRACFGAEAAWVADGAAGTAERAQAIGRAARRPGVRFALTAHDGLVAWGPTSDACYAATIEVTDRAATFVAARTRGPRLGGQAISALGDERRAIVVSELLPVLRHAMSDEHGTPALLVDASPRVRELVCSRDGAVLARAGAASAAHAPHTGHQPVWIDVDPWHDGVVDLVERVEHAVARHRDETSGARGPSPRVVLIGGVGLVAAGQTEPHARLVRDAYVRAIEAIAGADALGRFAPLPPP